MVAQFLQTFRGEHGTTMKVLMAIPPNQLNFKPHEKSWPMGELAWHIAYSQLGLAKLIASGSFDSYQQPPVPNDLEAIVAGAETYYNLACETISKYTPELLQGNFELPGGHKFPNSAFLWSGVLFHQIHHRGQLSVYIRMAGGKVPAIYGPSGDDNPFA
jgi:uncharacterized damage-inducible protein DinB